MRLASENHHRLHICSVRTITPCLQSRNKPGTVAFRTTRAEDTHLTLTAILFYVGANNSLKKIAVTDMHKKFCRDFILVGSIISCFNRVFQNLQERKILQRSLNKQSFLLVQPYHPDRCQ